MKTLLEIMKSTCELCHDYRNIFSLIRESWTRIPFTTSKKYLELRNFLAYLKVLESQLNFSKVTFSVQSLFQNKRQRDSEVTIPENCRKKTLYGCFDAQFELRIKTVV